jgi:hypothetical protein
MARHTLRLYEEVLQQELGVGQRALAAAHD